MICAILPTKLLPIVVGFAPHARTIGTYAHRSRQRDLRIVEGRGTNADTGCDRIFASERDSANSL